MSQGSTKFLNLCLCVKLLHQRKAKQFVNVVLNFLNLCLYDDPNKTCHVTSNGFIDTKGNVI